MTDTTTARLMDEHESPGWMDAVCAVIGADPDEWQDLTDGEDDCWLYESDGITPSWRIFTDLRVQFEQGWYLQNGDADDGAAVVRVVRGMLAAAVAMQGALEVSDG